MKPTLLEINNEKLTSQAKRSISSLALKIVPFYRKSLKNVSPLCNSLLRRGNLNDKIRKIIDQWLFGWGLDASQAHLIENAITCNCIADDVNQHALKIWQWLVAI